jgi:hypothetical protein
MFRVNANVRVLHICLAAAFLVSACSANHQREEREPRDVVMIVQNAMGTFVGRDLAEKLAVLIVREKYAAVFEADTPATASDEGDNWVVSVPVHVLAAASYDARLVPRAITVVLRKRDAAVMTIR